MDWDWSGAISNAVRGVVEFVPKLVGFLLILVIGLLVARLIGKAVDKILERVGFDRAVERGGIKKALARSQYDASDLVGKLVYYTLALFVLQLAFGVFGPNPISDLLTGVIAFLPKVLVALVIIVITAAIATAVRELVRGALGGLSYGPLLANAAAVLILALGIIAALNQVEIATTVTTSVLVAGLATVAGILVVGVGGGLVKPMQSRWESYLDTLSHETSQVRSQAQQSTTGTRQADPFDQSASAGADPSAARPGAPGHGEGDNSGGATLR